MGRLSTELLGDQPYFDGATYEPERDKVRLSGQLVAVKQILSDRRWHTISEIAQRIGGSEAGVSARIRDLKKERFGRHRIEKRYVSNGLWRYRMPQ